MKDNMNPDLEHDFSDNESINSHLENYLDNIPKEIREAPVTKKQIMSVVSTIILAKRLEKGNQIAIRIAPKYLSNIDKKIKERKERKERLDHSILSRKKPRARYINNTGEPVQSNRASSSSSAPSESVMNVTYATPHQISSSSTIENQPRDRLSSFDSTSENGEWRKLLSITPRNMNQGQENWLDLFNNETSSQTEEPTKYSAGVSTKKLKNSGVKPKSQNKMSRKI